LANLRYLLWSLNILDGVLGELTDARITWPSAGLMDSFSTLIESKYPRLRGAFGFVDGLKLPLQTAADQNLQSISYNGWLHSHKVSNVLTFAPDGSLLHALTNFPGSWHDTTVARPLFGVLLRDSHPPGKCILADTGFPRLRPLLRDRILVPLKTNSRPRGTHDQWQVTMALSRDVVSARQIAEWGMRSVQGSFARLKMPLPVHDMALRGRIIRVCMALHQLRVRWVGVSQIQTYWVDVWRGVDQDLYDNFQSMLFSEIVERDRASRVYNN